MEQYKTVQDIKTLRELKKAGLIIWHTQTGTKITGLYGGKKFTCTYVEDRTPGTPFTFEHKGKKYELKFFSGCFCPYVIELLK